MIQYCVGFAFSKDRKNILLIKKNRPDWQKNKLNGVGGLVEEGEYPIEAMVREFEEETGLTVYANDWEHIASLYFKENKVGVYFYSTFIDNIFSAKTMTDEAVGVYPVTDRGVLAISHTILPNLRWLIPAALDLNTPKPLVNR